MLKGGFDIGDNLGRDAFGAFLRLNSDHRHVAIVAKAGIEHLGDRDITQFQGRDGIAVSTHIHGLRAFGADGCAAAKVDTEIQANHEEHHDRTNHQDRRKP